MLRREFLAAMAATPLLGAGKAFSRDRLSAITDEIAATPADAIAFAHKYDLKWLELREVPGAKKHYFRASEEELKQAAKEFKENGIRISFFNTPYLKITLPGTEPVRRTPEKPEAREARIQRHQAEFDRRMQDLRTGINAAHILGVDTMRIFTFLRVEEPAKVEQRIADILGEMAEVCGKEKIKLVVENEASCNAATCGELASLMKLLPAKTTGLNWDPLNAVHQHEPAFPDGYRLLPKNRILNVQAKGHSVLDEKEKLDWRAIFKALDKDGYKGEVGLETHYFDGTKIEKSHLAMAELIKIVEPS